MQTKHSLTLTLLGGALAGMLLGLTAMRLSPLAQAAPMPATAKPTGAAPLMDLFTGKTYPLTLKAEQIDSSYRLVALVDSQGKPNLYATRGETAAAGGETYLVCYEVTVTDPKTSVPQPKPGTLAQIIFINLHAIQAMGGIIPIKPADTTPITAAP